MGISLRIYESNTKLVAPLIKIRYIRGAGRIKDDKYWRHGVHYGSVGLIMAVYTACPHWNEAYSHDDKEHENSGFIM